MMEYKPGDLVKIIYWNKRPNNWNSNGRMDHWRGCIVTIKEILPSGNIHIKEDYGERKKGYHWYWQEKDFLPIQYIELEDDLFTMD